MGSWSVYCGISQIAVTAGDKCVLLPLQKATNVDYLPYVPACLPIFGEYDDYGGIENIQKDDNTALIEEHFGITVEEFACFLIDGKHTYNRDEAQAIENKISNLEEIKDWRFMWINRKVYDFMSTYIDDYTRGTMHFGNTVFMKALGFEFIKEDENNQSYDPKRFRFLWKHGKKKFLSDNWVILSGTTKKNSYIHYIDKCDVHSKASSLSTYIKIPDNMKYIAEKAEWQMWRLYEDVDRFNNFWILNQSRDTFSRRLLEELARLRGDKSIKPEYKTLLSKYERDVEIFGDRVADLITVRHNLHPMSGAFYPMQKYVTPQCGEHAHHQVLLDRFAEINGEILKTHGQ